MTLGNTIKLNRKKSNLTQEELSKKIGISKNALWNYENNKRTIPVNVLIKLSTELNLPVPELLGFNEEDFKNTEVDEEIVKSLYSERLNEFFESYLYALMRSNYGYKRELTSDQLNNLMKIANNSLLPALELIINN